MSTSNEPLLAEIEGFLSRTGIAPSIFGWRAIGDPNLMRNLKAGRELRSATLRRVREFMAAEREGVAA